MNVCTNKSYVCHMYDITAALSHIIHTLIHIISTYDAYTILMYIPCILCMYRLYAKVSYMLFVRMTWTLIYTLCIFLKASLAIESQRLARVKVFECAHLQQMCFYWYIVIDFILVIYIQSTSYSYYWVRTWPSRRSDLHVPKSLDLPIFSSCPTCLIE